MDLVIFFMMYIICLLLIVLNNQISVDLSRLLSMFIDQMSVSSNEETIEKVIDVRYTIESNFECLSLYYDVPMSPSEDTLGYDMSFRGFHIRCIGKDNRFFNGGVSSIMSPYDDLDNWHLVFFLDGSLNKYLTYKTYWKEGIDDLVSLFPAPDEEYVNQWLNSFLFYDYYVDSPPEYCPGEEYLLDSLRERTRINSMEELHLEKGTRISFSFVVDKDGRTSLLEIDETGDELLNKEIERLALTIEKDGFKPAIHRGKRVNCITNISIYKKWLLKNNLKPVIDSFPPI